MVYINNGGENVKKKMERLCSALIIILKGKDVHAKADIHPLRNNGLLLGTDSKNNFYLFKKIIKKKRKPKTIFCICKN